MVLKKESKSIKLNCCTTCNIGPKRKNEDTICAKVYEDCDKALFIVCDGMSGLHSGDLASQTVVNAFVATWEDNHKSIGAESMLAMAVKQAKAEIDVLSHYDVGTTMVMAATEGENILIAHLGDSRAYYIRPGEGLLYQTQDHITIGEEGWPYVSKGFFNFRDVEKPTIKKLRCKPGDRILLCSDGVSGCYRGNALIELLAGHMEISTIMSNIIGYCDKYATDNYSAILLEVEQI